MQLSRVFCYGADKWIGDAYPTALCDLLQCSLFVASDEMALSHVFQQHQLQLKQ